MPKAVLFRYAIIRIFNVILVWVYGVFPFPMTTMAMV